MHTTPTGPRVRNRLRRSPTLVAVAVLILLVITGGPTNAAGPGAGGGGAVGGTAKPPVGAIAPTAEPTLPDPTFSVATTGIHAFTEVGFLQHATVSGAECAAGTPASNFGGTAVINNVTVTVPCNMTVQMPANTFTWADFVNQSPSLALDGSPYPSFELMVVGNIVGSSPTNGRHIAGLMFFSQQSLDAGSGYITGIDYPDGSFTVDGGAGNPPVKVQLNDPKITTAGDPANGTGRFSAGQSPDPRLSVDQGNPTVTAATGYPMCVPRTDPASSDDARCPRVNRPRTPSATPVTGVVQGCRTFGSAGVAIPASGDLPAPTAGQLYCSAFVMPDPTKRATTDPDATQQTPFEVGDHVTFAGTLVKAADGSQFISAHTVTADVDVFTQPGTHPSYLAIRGMVIGSADPRATAVTGVTQETKDRLVLDASTTDLQSPVDIYLPDIDPKSGQVRNRWVTPQAMTGESNGPFGGGITTQNLGPQPERARLRANKAPVGLLSNPTRTIRVANRVACKPTAASGHAFDGTSTTVSLSAVDTCLKAVPLAANGLQAGEYTAPMFNFLFPENVRAGDPLIPNDLWHLGFLRYGEGPNPITPTVGPLQPTPW
jgi:hypothetical protein